MKTIETLIHFVFLPKEGKKKLKMFRRALALFVFVILSLLLFFGESKSLDPYKVLGVDRSATQREIQKAFHKLSLQYHPDKNKNKGAQEKFADINNAYEILSDEEKRKNYDLYGDEKGNPGFDSSNFAGGNSDGYTYFTSGGPGSGGWQTTGSHGNAKTFSFSFGGDPGFSGNPFTFGFGDMFSNLFGGGMGGSGMGGGNHHSKFSSTGRPNSEFTSGSSGSGGFKSGFNSPGKIEDVSVQFFSKQVKDQGLTWLLLFYTPSMKGYHAFESIIEDVASQLHGAVGVGRVNCLSNQGLCRDLGVSLSGFSRLFIYSYKHDERGALVEYGGNYDARNLKNFVQDQLPRFSKRVDLNTFDFSSASSSDLPQVLLLSTKKDTPVAWRVLSGLYHKRFVFFDAEVHDVSRPLLKRLGVDSIPSVIGRLANREELVLKSGIAFKDLKSGIDELKTLLERFEKKNKKAASNQAKKKPSSSEQGGKVPHFTASNMDNICNEATSVCIIGVYRSFTAKEKLEAILSEVSQKSLLRSQNLAQISYALLDANKYPSFLSSFDKYGFKSLDRLLVAYKPKRRKYAAHTKELTLEEVEKFVSAVVNGDIQFSKILRQPTF